MTDARLPVIDADGHVTEPPTVWAEYVEEAYRGRAPRPALDELGHPCQVVGDRIAMRDALLLTLGPERSFSGYTPRAGGFDPAARLVDLDSEGIDIAVLYPSIGLCFSDTRTGSNAWTSISRRGASSCRSSAGRRPSTSAASVWCRWTRARRSS